MQPNIHQPNYSQPQYSQQEAQTYSFRHDFEGSATLTATLVHAISDVTGVDVTNAEFTLADYVDPDALDRLFQLRPDGSKRMNGHVSFSIWGNQVTVYSDGNIFVSPPQPQPQPPAPRS